MCELSPKHSHHRTPSRGGETQQGVLLATELSDVGLPFKDNSQATPSPVSIRMPLKSSTVRIGSRQELKGVTRNHRV